MSAYIRDYLQTQGLNLNPETVYIAQAAARAVLDHAVADRPQLWWRDDTDGALCDYFADTAERRKLLQSMFAAVDAACSRLQPNSATLYAWLPENSLLVRLAHIGEATENLLRADEAGCLKHLAARTAQSGWLNLADNIPQWLAQNHLHGTHNQRSGSQISLPLCAENGRVAGVLHVEYLKSGAPDEDAQAAWVGLVLALPAPLELFLSSDISQHTQEETQ